MSGPYEHVGSSAIKAMLARLPVGSSPLAAMQLAAAEFSQIQALLDRCQVPTHGNGEKLSAAQRVAVLVNVHEGLLKSLGKEPVTRQ